MVDTNFTVWYNKGIGYILQDVAFYNNYKRYRMPEYKKDVKVGSDAWVDLNTASGISAGGKLTIQNKSQNWVRLIESATQPSVDTTDGDILTDLENPNGFARVPAGSLTIWALCAIDGRSSRLSVQQG